MSEVLSLLAPLLLDWYRSHKRLLPWRDAHNPYYTWISEIMLQQTRVEAVIPYFERFVSAYPDIRSLALAEEEEVLKLWEGLGYYSRARNLLAGARQVLKEYNGELPQDYSRLLQLKGIGVYTAGAISSIAFGQPVPAVDGNVLRIIARLTEESGDITSETVRRRIAALLKEIIPADRPGDFNQALMDLGAAVCLPVSAPLCSECPLSGICEAYRSGKPGHYPVRSPKKARRIEEHTVLLILSGHQLLLRRRPDQGLLAGMYEPLNIPGRIGSREALEYARSLSFRPLSLEILPDAKHIFTHIEWHMSGYLIRAAGPDKGCPDGYVCASPEDLTGKYPVPSAYQMFISILISRGE